MARIKALIALILVLCMGSVSGQSVGVVLSGGGAKGLYHIGVLKALEENNIPVDYISGTSMGAIVAGLYATGYTPQQMWDLFRTDRVSYWMSGQIEEKYHYYFKQPRPNASMLNLWLDFSNSKLKAALPTNLIPSRQIDVAFMEFFAGANARSGGDFDNLMIPFRCVATDAVERKEVVFRDGDMGKAIRASMSIPLVFRPLKADSTFYYDGGIYNNFPWKVLMDDFNPDILIGSKCTEGNTVLTDDNLLDQVLALTMMFTDYDLPRESDIMIEYAFDDVSMLDYSKVEYIVTKGYDDAMKAMPQILERIGRRTDDAQLAAKRLEYRASLPELVFDDYELTGMKDNQLRYMDRMLSLRGRKGEDKYITYDRFRSQYFRLLTEGDIECDYPAARYNPATGYFTLGLHASNKPSFKVMLGGNISSTSMNQAYIGAEYKTIDRRAQTFLAEGYFSGLYTSVYVGGRTDFFMQRPFEIEYGYNFNYYNYFRSNFGSVARNNDLSYTKYSDPYFTAAISMPLGRMSIIELRANLGRDRYSYFQQPNYSDDDIMDKTRFEFFSAKLELERNNLNYYMYPTRGIRQTASVAYITGREDYSPGNFSPAGADRRFTDNRKWFVGNFGREHYMNWDGWFTLGYHIEGVYSNHPGFSNDYATNITSPAFTPTTHSKLVYLRDYRYKSYAAAGLMPIIEFGPRFYLANSAYMFVQVDKDIFDDVFSKHTKFIFNSSLVYQTPIGAASLTLSKYNAQTNNNWFLTFNFGYALFHRNGLFY